MTDDFLPISEAARQAMTTPDALAKRIERGQISEEDLRWEGKRRLVRLSAVLALGRAVRTGKTIPEPDQNHTSLPASGKPDNSDNYDKMSELRADLDYALGELRQEMSESLSELRDQVEAALRREENARRKDLQTVLNEIRTREQVSQPAPVRERQQRPFLCLANVLRRG